MYSPQISKASDGIVSRLFGTTAVCTNRKRKAPSRCRSSLVAKDMASAFRNKFKSRILAASSCERARRWPGSIMNSQTELLSSPGAHSLSTIPFCKETRPCSSFTRVAKLPRHHHFVPHRRVVYLVDKYRYYLVDLHQLVPHNELCTEVEKGYMLRSVRKRTIRLKLRNNSFAFCSPRGLD